jgi:hypothetical protein
VNPERMSSKDGSGKCVSGKSREQVEPCQQAILKRRLFIDGNLHHFVANYTN